MATKTNPECDDCNCRKQQEEFKKREELKPKPVVVVEVDTAPLHDENPFEEELKQAEREKPQLTEGVTVAYTKPAKSATNDTSETVGDVSRQSLDELMKQMQSL
ncbi:ubiquitin-like modifier-activating enzyme 5 [Mytilus galloprovincialis]|uniref:Ubiquitin-like modifier-activating enzyme 5 n=1 Tax=Mytilus galloprovincialis TaxID=29158 RepID=A0A8B6BJX2_MYTGA|nr:ubiquitin-like modifier-activating enzyme 5 [Mytilus galloprovincialis]